VAAVLSQLFLTDREDIDFQISLFIQPEFYANFYPSPLKGGFLYELAEGFSPTAA